MVRSGRLLLESSLDYAGTFPPAGLPLAEAVTGYARARRGPDRWLLGRLVVDASRLPDVERLIEARPSADTDSPWDISAIVGAQAAGQLDDIARFMERGMLVARIACLEFAPLPPAQIRDTSERVRWPVECFFELPLDARLEAGLEAVRTAGRHAKVRTGGVRRSAFPPPEELARFLAASAAAGLAFKATAGLHHAMRGCYPLTAEEGGETAAMYGFLNVAVAAAFVRAGATPAEIADALAEPAAEAFRFDEDGIRWRDRIVTSEELAETRRRFFRSFGSCAFDEPVAELRRLGLL